MLLGSNYPGLSLSPRRPLICQISSYLPRLKVVGLRHGLVEVNDDVGSLFGDPVLDVGGWAKSPDQLTPYRWYLDTESGIFKLAIENTLRNQEIVGSIPTRCWTFPLFPSSRQGAFLPDPS